MRVYSHSYPGFDLSVVTAAAAAIGDGLFSGRDLVKAAEIRLSKFMNTTRLGVLTNTGFSALQAALVSRSIPNKVYLPTICCPSVWYAIRSVGSTPVLVDVSDTNPLLDVNSLPHNLGEGDVILFPQLFGLKQSLKDFNKYSDVQIIEDLAQSFSPDIDEYATSAICSFSPTKLFTTGFGGAVLLRDKEAYQKAKAFLDADHGLEEEVRGELPFRVHAPYSDYQAAMLMSQLDRYEFMITRRWSLIRLYDELLDNPKRLQPRVPFRYQLLVEEGRADTVVEKLKSVGVHAHALGAHLLHRTLPVEGEFPNAEQWKASIVSLPLHENLQPGDVEVICKSVRGLI